MTYFELVSACFMANVLGWIIIILLCAPFVIMDALKSKNDDNNDKENKE